MSSTQRDRKTKKGSKDIAAERLSTPDQLDQIIRVASFPSWLALSALLAVLIAALVAAFVIPVPITVRGQGILINPGGILAVVSETEGRLIELSVDLEDQVQFNQVVAKISQPALMQQIDGNREALEEARQQREKISEFQKQSDTVRDQGIKQQREALVTRYDSASQRLRNLIDLYTKQQNLPDLYPEIQLQETMDRINDANDELNTINNAIGRFEEVISSSRLKNERELLQLDLEISDLERESKRLQAELEQKSKVRSPYAGTVVEIKVNEGDVIARHDDLFSLLPTGTGENTPEDLAPTDEDLPFAEICREQATLPTQNDALVAVLYVPSADGKKIKADNVVQLELAPFKREKFGFLLGCVEEVAEVPSTRKGMMRVLQNSQLVEQLSGAVAPFEVRVRLPRLPVDGDGEAPRSVTGYYWTSGKGPPEQIYVGTLSEAYIVTETLHPIDILLPEITQTLGLSG